MPTIVRNGIKLVFEDRSAGKPAFVFVHGTSCNRSFFAPRDDEARVAEPGEPRPRVTRVSRPDTQSRGLAGHPIRVDSDRQICSGAVRPRAATNIQFWRGAPVGPTATRVRQPLPARGVILSCGHGSSRNRRQHEVGAFVPPVCESPGGPCTHWKAPPCHGAHPKRPFASDLRNS